MKALLHLLAAAGVLASTSACADSAPPERLVLTGASTVAPLAAEIGKRFERLRPGVRVDVQTGGSGRGLSDAREGLSDIGLVSRALKPEEGDLVAFPVARDGVGLIVHKDNPVGALTDEQVVGIYTGRIARWKEVGGQDAPITVVTKADGRSTLELFCAYYQLKNADLRAHVVIGDNAQGIKTVAGNPQAVGYVSIGSAVYEAGQGTPIKLLPVGGVAATIETVADGTFPLSRPLNLVLRAAPRGRAKEFVEFARSAQVHDLVREHFFVPIAR